MLRNLMSALFAIRRVDADAIDRIKRALIAATTLVLLMSISQDASAQLAIPFVNQIGCAVVKWMTGPLSIIVFLVVAVGVMVVGMMSKMDWGKIVTVTIIYGALQGIVTLLLTTGSIAVPAACF